MLPIPQGWAEPAFHKEEEQEEADGNDGDDVEEVAVQQMARLHESLHRSLLLPLAVPGRAPGPCTAPSKSTSQPTALPQPVAKRIRTNPCPPEVVAPLCTSKGQEDEERAPLLLSTTPSVRRQQQRDRDRSLALNSQGHSRSASMVNAIRSAIEASRSFESRTRLCELNLDTVLSSTSYRGLMRQAFGSDGSIVPGAGGGAGGGTSEGGAQPRRAVPTITRAFEVGCFLQPVNHASVESSLSVCDGLLTIIASHTL